MSAEVPTSPYGKHSGKAAYAYPERANVKMSEALRVLDEGVHPLVIHSSQMLAVALLVTAAVNHFPKITATDLLEIWRSVQLQVDVAYAFALTALALLLLLYYALRHPRPVYLVDFATWQLPAGEDDGSLCATADFLRRTVTECGRFSGEAVDFQMKLFERNQISERCYFPPGIRGYRKGERDFDFSMAAARKEFETVVFATVDDLFAKTGCKPTDVRARARAEGAGRRAAHPARAARAAPRPAPPAAQIDILVVNCSLFNPTPSLAAIVINHYRMKDSIQSYSLGGMGCSAGIIAVHLAKDLLQVYPRRRALVISTENITQNFYQGNDKSMLISNTLFRMGAAAVLLSGRRADRRAAKYRLLHTVRTHRGADPEAYRCVFQEEDAQGNVGVRLSKNVMECAGAAMKTNISVLAPLILPVSEQVRFLLNFVARKWLRLKGARPGAHRRSWQSRLFRAAARRARPSQTAPLPRARRASALLRPGARRRQRVRARLHQSGAALLHPHGRARGARRAAGQPLALRLPPRALALLAVEVGQRLERVRLVRDGLARKVRTDPVGAARRAARGRRWPRTGRRRGCSRAPRRVPRARVQTRKRRRRGDKVWQIGFGSGFKCNSAVWQACRTVEGGTLS